jgi:hypothetical protein
LLQNVRERRPSVAATSILVAGSGARATEKTKTLQSIECASEKTPLSQMANKVAISAKPTHKEANTQTFCMA